jgi:uncharacterized membrane protein
MEFGPLLDKAANHWRKSWRVRPARPRQTRLWHISFDTDAYQPEGQAAILDLVSRASVEMEHNMSVRRATPARTPEPGPTGNRCAISGDLLARNECVRLSSLRLALQERIRVDHPRLGENAVLGRLAVDGYRSRLIEELLAAEHGEVRALDRQVAASIMAHDTIALDTDSAFDEERSLGDRMADMVAAFGGSWNFIALFGVVLALWMAGNVIAGGARAFDPYPFILLNLVLSCIAAIQAPVIMMSQRRQEAKDRLRSQSDYRVNLKAELEIRHLHEKLDHLLTHQWDRLAEIQQLQIELLQEIRTDANSGARGKRPESTRRKPPGADQNTG